MFVKKRPDGGKSYKVGKTTPSLYENRIYLERIRLMVRNVTQMIVRDDKMEAQRDFTLVVSVGDCNGIGLEVFAKALEILGKEDRHLQITYRVAANPYVIDDYYRQLGLLCAVDKEGMSIHGIRCEILPCTSRPKVVHGATDGGAGELAWEALEKAVAEVRDGTADALLTLPVSKSTLKLAGYPFPGQTEFLAARCSVDKPLMILCTTGVRVGLVTIHIPLAQVPMAVTRESVAESIRALHSSLQGDFGCPAPRIAVLGLNPHAGENGEIGHEEIDVVIPAIADCVSSGMQVEGPFPADGFFAHGGYRESDGILAMYHDQGLIPLKMLARGGGVNVTAGLPIVRTSPDHGTAYNIAGKGIADPASTVEAIRLARHIAAIRRHVHNTGAEENAF